jgi:S1-C subfamily serine protease
MGLILIVALCFTLTFTSASADDAAVMDARNGVVRIVFAYEDSQYTYVSQGSGFCVGIEGEPVQFIITNAHVITATDVDGEILGYAREVTIVFDDYNADSTVKAKVLKVFTNGVDLAVLKLEAPTTLRKPLPLRSAQEMEIMDTVHALGFPAIADDSSGYAPSKTEDVTITSGKVTKMQYLDGDTKFMQVDAAISSGNSGGPLVDQNGAVIGINTQVNDPSHGTGLGYAL